jgi:hypothetical protein
VVDASLEQSVKYGALIAECDPMQNHWDIDATLGYLERFEIRTVLEIGLYQGGSFATWSRALLPEHLIGITKDEVELHPNLPARVNGDRTNPPKVDLIFRDSHTAAARLEAEAALAGDSIDFLFIDGGHSYNEIAHDFFTYSPLVREGGVIGIHDVNRGCEGVNLFWESCIRQLYRSVLFSDALVRAGGLGIGLVLGPGDGSSWASQVQEFFQ